MIIALGTDIILLVEGSDIFLFRNFIALTPRFRLLRHLVPRNDMTGYFRKKEIVRSVRVESDFSKASIINVTTP